MPPHPLRASLPAGSPAFAFVRGLGTNSTCMVLYAKGARYSQEGRPEGLQAGTHSGVARRVLSTTPPLLEWRGRALSGRCRLLFLDIRLMRTTLPRWLPCLALGALHQCKPIALVPIKVDSEF